MQMKTQAGVSGVAGGAACSELQLPMDTFREICNARRQVAEEFLGDGRERSAAVTARLEQISNSPAGRASA